MSMMFDDVDDVDEESVNDTARLLRMTTEYKYLSFPTSPQSVPSPFGRQYA